MLCSLALTDTSTPMQRPGEVDSLPSSSLRRWHPKLTPYRLLVLGTTVGLGSAKAVAVQKGEQSASTTLEWVSGVVIFLILHTLSTYDESPKEPPPLLGWVFSVDCMDYLWRLLSLVHIPRPSYASAPEPAPRVDTDAVDKAHVGNVVPLTLYQLFVCFTTVVFGLMKAIMTYFGYSVGANWVDWTLGVVITSVLFIIGMYENNAIGIGHAFFVPNHSTETQFGFAAATISITALLWSAGCIWLVSLLWASPDSAFFSTEYVRVPLTALPPLAVLREHLFDTCFSLFMALMLVVSLFAGVAGVSAVLSSSGLPRWADAGEWMMGRRPAWKDGYTALEPEGRPLSKRIAYHTASLTIFLLGCALFLAFWVVSVAANVEEGYALLHGRPYLLVDSSSDPASPISNSDPVSLTMMGGAILFQLSGAGVTIFVMWFMATQALLVPFWRWREGDENWERDVLF